MAYVMAEPLKILLIPSAAKAALTAVSTARLKRCPYTTQVVLRSAFRFSDARQSQRPALQRSEKPQIRGRRDSALQKACSRCARRARQAALLRKKSGSRAKPDALLRECMQARYLVLPVGCTIRCGVMACGIRGDANHGGTQNFAMKCVAGLQFFEDGVVRILAGVDPFDGVMEMGIERLAEGF